MFSTWIKKLYEVIIELTNIVYFNFSDSLPADVVKQVLKQLNLDLPSLSEAEKIQELCIVFKASVTESLR